MKTTIPPGLLTFTLAPQLQRPAMLNGKVGKVEKLEATVAQQQKQIDTLTAQLKEQAAQIQKVSAQFEASKPGPQVVNNP
jgi:septal ring factor EnvC (AmiA/AmiB activator)